MITSSGLSGKETSDSNKFSNYGTYSVDDTLSLSYPGTKIKFERINDDTFSYYRKDIEDSVVEKIVNRPTGNLVLEICPVLPMNLPARKTNDLMFLRFEKQVYVSKNSKVDIFVPFPIEIGVFVTNDDGNSSLLDCFTCEPIHSRFGLYGSPDNGNLCMYAKVPIQKHQESFVFAQTKISISNNTDHGVLVGKVVFPVSEHVMYYVENSTEAHIDDLFMEIVNEFDKDVARVSRIEYRPKSNWKVAPTIEKTSVNGKFLMNRGLD